MVFRPTPLKNDGVKVSWDDDIPNMMGKIIHSCSKPPSSYRFKTRTRDITDITTYQLSVSAPAVGQKSPHHIRIEFGAAFTTIDTVSCLPEMYRCSIVMSIRILPSGYVKIAIENGDL